MYFIDFFGSNKFIKQAFTQCQIFCVVWSYNFSSFPGSYLCLYISFPDHYEWSAVRSSLNFQDLLTSDGFSANPIPPSPSSLIFSYDYCLKVRLGWPKNDRNWTGHDRLWPRPQSPVTTFWKERMLVTEPVATGYGKTDLAKRCALK